MNLLQTSGDLLNIGKTIFFVLLGAFLSWLIYYLAMMTKQFYLITKEMRERIKKVDEVISAFKEKIEHSASYLLLIGEGVKKLSEIALKYWEKEKKGSKK